MAHRFVKLLLAIEDSGPRNFSMNPLLLPSSDFKGRVELRHLIELLVKFWTGIKEFLQTPANRNRAIFQRLSFDLHC